MPRFRTSLALLALSLAIAAPLHAAAPEAPISLAAYRTRLESLDRLVAACQQKIGPDACKSSLVGDDLQVTLPGPVTARKISLEWLRDLLAQAAKPAPAKPPANASGDHKIIVLHTEPPNPPRVPEYVPPTLAQRLQLARDRLQDEWQRAADLSTTTAPQSTLAADHQALDRILTAKEYKLAVAPRSLKDRFLEKLSGWLNTLIGKLSNLGAKSRLFGLIAECVFIAALCVALVWFLIYLERQGRAIRAASFATPGASAASARDWQLWLADANRAAAQSQWRDAIHFLYWASISRLESSGLWPADRARTPREYLALLSAENRQRPDLTALTRSFERTWYANRPAAESDFERVRQLAARLGAQ
jgi:hypothetical protein